jgi:arabinogalactan oligomer/maltooligosaccharide transport system permease protein
LTIGVSLLPLWGASWVDKRLDKQGERKIASIWVWLGGIVVGLALAAVLNVAAAYQTLMETGDFFVVVWRTILFVVLRVPVSFLVGLTLAIILNNNYVWGRTFWRVVLFIPWAASSVAILMSLVWQFFFREQGTINQVLAVFGIEGLTWLRLPIPAFFIVVLVDVWYSYPFFMIAILGALSGISNEIYEAADVDGATFWQQLRGLTLPLIRPAILPAAVLTSITAFQMFGTVWAITQGGPIQQVGKPGATEFVMVFAYKQIYQLQNYGLATAFAVILFIFLFTVTIYSLRITRITKGAY